MKHDAELPQGMELPGMWDKSDLIGGETDCGWDEARGDAPQAKYLPRWRWYIKRFARWLNEVVEP